MLTNSFVNTCLSPIKKFKGVFSSDNIYKLKLKGECIIINFDRSYEPGSHFIAIYCVNKNTIMYFDSLNLDSIPQEIYNYIKSYKLSIDMSFNLQNIFSTYCGFYCILFLYSISISKRYWNKISKKFQSNMSIKNDNLCIRYLCTSIKKYLNKSE